MEKLIRARKRLAQNSKKGFTLVELIVVIVIIAILIAALLPAVLGAISQANAVADEADGRTLLTAASVAVINDQGAIIPVSWAGVNSHIAGGIASLGIGGTITVFVEAGAGATAGIPVGVSWTTGRDGAGSVGIISGTGVTGTPIAP